VGLLHNKTITWQYPTTLTGGVSQQSRTGFGFTDGGRQLNLYAGFAGVTPLAAVPGGYYIGTTWFPPRTAGQIAASADPESGLAGIAEVLGYQSQLGVLVLVDGPNLAGGLGASTSSGGIAGVGTIDTTMFADGFMGSTVAGVGALAGDIVGLGFISTSGGGLAGIGAILTDLEATGALASSLNGVGAVIAALNATGGLATIIAGVGALDGSINATGNISTVIAGVGSVAGDMAGGAPLTATIAGVGGVTAAIAGGAFLDATVAGTGGLVADITGGAPLTATLTGVGALSADIAGGAPMVATLAGVGSITGGIIGTWNMGVTLGGVGSVGAGLTALGNITATLSGSGTLTASFAGTVGNMEAVITVCASGGLTAAEIADAVWDETMADHVLTGSFGEGAGFLYYVNHHKVITDPTAGTYDVYAEDDVTVIFTGSLWQDAAGTTPYSGAGAERRDRLTP
jgi:hypothetical protein